MVMTKPALVLIVLIILIGYGCKKNSYETDIATLAEVDTTKGYAPAVSGSYIKYRAVSGTIIDTITNTLTGSTTTINAKLFNVASIYSIAHGLSTAYYANISHTYTLRTASAGTTLEILYLIDNVPAGSTWTAPLTDLGTIGGAQVQLIGKLTEKNISRTVSNLIFNNVIRTTIQLQYNTGLAFTTYATYEYYIAKGVGIIEVDASSINFMGVAASTSTQNLISFRAN